MKDILKNIGRFCENHVEKMVLVLVGLICIWLFFTRVIFTPNMVTVGNETLGPGDVDRVVAEKTSELRSLIESKGLEANTEDVDYTTRLAGPIDPCDPVAEGLPPGINKGLQGLYASAIDRAVKGVAFPNPSPLPQGSGLRRQYQIPAIGPVVDAAVDHIRAVAYVPLGEVTVENTYDKIATEPNDIDLVTVEAKFDVADLYRRFYASFAGEDVQEEHWRDPCLAKPVFAAVDLQRQQLQADGTWSAWKSVPRTRVDNRRQLFEIIETVDQLPPGGVNVRLLQYNDEDVMADLLQPLTYQIASAEDDWFPPTFHQTYVEMREKEAKEAKRKEREDQQDRAGEDRTGRIRPTTGRTGATNTSGRYSPSGAGSQYGNPTDSRRTGTRPTRRRDSTTGMGSDYGTGRITDPGTRRPGGRRRPGDTTMGDGMYDTAYEGMNPIDGQLLNRETADVVYYDFEEALLQRGEDLAKRKEPLLIWAMDDTVEPLNTYRYRIRLGVFNPVAGTDQLIERHLDLKDQVILWSRFSGETEAVEIPPKLAFFAKSVQQAEQKATVEVSRYALGRWHSQDFPVKPGEVIGEVVEPETETKRPRVLGDPRTAIYTAPTTVQEEAPMPDKIDYRTGAVVVDLVEVNDWQGPQTFRPRIYYDLLYTTDGTSLERLPVATTNWTPDVARMYTLIKNSQKETPQPFRAFKARQRMRGPRPGVDGLYEGVEGYEDYDMMGGPSPY